MRSSKVVRFCRNLFKVIFIICFFIAENSFAQARLKNVKLPKVGFIYETYSGDKDKSIANGGAGYGIELAIDTGGDYLRYFLKTKMIYSTGQDTFLDNATEVLSTYKLTQVVPELGISIYPVPRKTAGMNLYVSLSGVASYNLLDLTPISKVVSGTTSSVTSFTKLRSRDQGYGYGGGVSAGFEVLLGRKAKAWISALYGEVGFRQQYALLANQSDFQLNSFQFVLGAGF
jgi:hypothetical protein